MFGNLIISALLTASIGAKSLPVTVPVPHVEQVEQITPTYNCFGSYNFKDVISWDSYFSDTSLSIVFEQLDNGQTQHLCLVPIHRSNSTATIWYCTSIDFSFGYVDDVEIVFNVYNYAYNYPVTWVYNFVNGDVLSDIVTYDFGDLIFEVRDSFLLHDDVALVFQSFFTFSENTYTKNYTGYYSFNNNLSSIPSPIAVFGYTIFNQTSYTFMFNYGDGVHTDSTTSLYMSYYMLNDAQGLAYEGYAIEPYALPFNKTYVVSANLYMTNVKMSSRTYIRMQSIGVFGYVRDTSYDNVGFKDLLFGVADAPVYFISSLLSFELFGVNLFIAFAGLLTICCILLLIKRFW